MIAFVNTNTSSNFTGSSQYFTETYGANWALAEIEDAEHTHMADLYINLSPPCGNVEENYAFRSTNSKEVFETGECSFSMNGSVFHPGYISTGFQETELDVLKENNLLD